MEYVKIIYHTTSSFYSIIHWNNALDVINLYRYGGLINGNQRRIIPADTKKEVTR